MSDKRIKVTSAEIIEKGGTPEHPYYQIKYKQLGKEDYNIGFGSYQKDYVEEWLDTCFEVYDFEEIASKLPMEEKMSICTFCERYNTCVMLHDSKCGTLINRVKEIIMNAELESKKLNPEEKVVQFPVDMDDMQRRILVSLLNARKEATEESILTARGAVAIIDALFYLVKGGVYAGIDCGNPDVDKTGAQHMKRISKDEYYLGIALAVCKRSTCLKRRYGCVIVKNDEIIATGYNGSPRGEVNCCDVGECKRMNVSHNSGDYSDCCSVHAEQNAIISAGRQEMIGATLYLVGDESADILTVKQRKVDVRFKEINNATPCPICERMIKNAGIVRVVNRDGEICL